jgi:hypothetical protein
VVLEKGIPEFSPATTRETVSVVQEDISDLVEPAEEEVLVEVKNKLVLKLSSKQKSKGKKTPATLVTPFELKIVFQDPPSFHVSKRRMSKKQYLISIPHIPRQDPLQ